MRTKKTPPQIADAAFVGGLERKARVQRARELLLEVAEYWVRRARMHGNGVVRNLGKKTSIAPVKVCGECAYLEDLKFTDDAAVTHCPVCNGLLYGQTVHAEFFLKPAEIDAALREWGFVPVPGAREDDYWIPGCAPSRLARIMCFRVTEELVMLGLVLLFLFGVAGLIIILCNAFGG